VLALGGGGARGLAHIGVLKVLERQGLAIGGIAGTSMGGLIGAPYGAGVCPETLEQEALRLSSVRQLLPLTDAALTRRGLFSGQRVTDYLQTHLGVRTFADTRLPVALVAVDLDAQQEVILREGPLVDAVRATIAIPGVFVPVERDGVTLVDGGLLNNVPADVARSLGPGPVVAVNVHGDGRVAPFPRLPQRALLPTSITETLNVLYRGLNIMMNRIATQRLAEVPPDVLILPAISAEVTPLTGFGHAREIIAAGERATERALPDIERCLRDLGPPELARDRPMGRPDRQ
jgi:NTE family protein